MDTTQHKIKNKGKWVTNELWKFQKNKDIKHKYQLKILPFKKACFIKKYDSFEYTEKIGNQVTCTCPNKLEYRVMSAKKDSCDKTQCNGGTVKSCAGKYKAEDRTDAKVTCSKFTPKLDVCEIFDKAYKTKILAEPNINKKVKKWKELLRS